MSRNRDKTQVEPPSLSDQTYNGNSHARSIMNRNPKSYLQNNSGALSTSESVAHRPWSVGSEQNRVNFTAADAPRLAPPPPEHYQHDRQTSRRRGSYLGNNESFVIPNNIAGGYELPPNSKLDINVDHNKGMNIVATPLSGQVNTSHRPADYPILQPGLPPTLGRFQSSTVGRSYTDQMPQNIEVNVAMDSAGYGTEKVFIDTGGPTVDIRPGGGPQRTASKIRIHVPANHPTAQQSAFASSEAYVMSPNEVDPVNDLQDALREVINETSACRQLEDIEDLLEIHRLNEIEKNFRGIREGRREKLYQLQERRRHEETERRVELFQAITQRIKEERQDQSENQGKLIQILAEYGNNKSTNITTVSQQAARR